MNHPHQFRTQQKFHSINYSKGDNQRLEVDADIEEHKSPSDSF